MQVAREKHRIWDAFADEAASLQDSMIRSLQICEETLYEDLDDTDHDAEWCLFTPEVTCTEIQQETINAILGKGDRGAENRSHSDVSRPSQRTFCQIRIIYRVEFAAYFPLKVALLQVVIKEGSLMYMAK